MSKQKNLKLNSKNNETTAKELFKPLSQKEQQTVSGGWQEYVKKYGYTARRSSSNSFS